MHDLEKGREVYVAHFDILGIGALLDDTEQKNWGAWQTIKSFAEAQELSEFPLTCESRERLSERFFSDTILITTTDDSVESIHSIIVRSLELFRCSLRNSIPIRGGIAHGYWFESNENNKDIFTGNSLSRAYKIGESQQMLGITICDKSTEIFSRNSFSLASKKDVILQYMVPCKNGKSKSQAILNWPALCAQELKGIDSSSAETLCNHFFTVGKYDEIDKGAKEKYVNTVHFLNTNG